MSNNTTTLSISSNDTPIIPEQIHKLISCENLTNLAETHSDLCHGLYASIHGGASMEAIKSIAETIMSQSEDISSAISLKASLDPSFKYSPVKNDSPS